MDMIQQPAMKLPPTLDLAAADELRRSILQKLGGGGGLALDASAVETLALPGAQVIYSALRSHPHVSVVDPSPQFDQAFADLAIDWRSARCEGPGSDISAYAGAPADEAPGDSPAETQSGPSAMKRILTIDDSKTMRDMLMFTLADAGYDVLQGVDGQDGLDVLGDAPVDVVITDINMPRMDGYEVIRQLRANPIHKNTPILVLTTESDTEKRQLARSAGATGWMVKPFDPERLLATVRKVCP